MNGNNNENLEKILEKAKEFHKNFEVLINEYPMEIDRRMAFLLGFCSANLGMSNDLKDLTNLLDSLRKANKNQGNSLEKLKKLQQEEEKQFFEEKIEKNKKEEFTKPQKRLNFKEISQLSSAEICDICLEDLYKSPIHLMENCSHVFHIECLNEYLNNAVFLFNI